MTKLPDSPCRRACTLDREDICVGCGRTLDEILEWSRAPTERKQAIVAAADLRRAERIANYPPL
ncbi:MAG: DUF1289 domain-containing protein [Stellaceae bacterium]